MSEPRKAHSLDVLLDQVNSAFPNRSKANDGWIGDTAHAQRKSDHNVNEAGVVQAIDITHDPARGLDSYKLADKLLASHDPRTKYIISNGRIGSSYATNGAMPWTWRPYSGPNAHKQHVHISVMDDPHLYDSTEQWNFTSEVVPEPLPPPPTGARERELMRKIVNYEYELRPFKIYTVTDGTREIAGINEAKHPETFAKVAALLGDDVAVENAVIDFYLQYTNLAQQWHSDPGVQFYLRDTILNRGPKGAAIILQKAVGAEQDGAVGPLTKAAAAKIKPDELLERLDDAREEYEIEKYGKRPALWKGMQNRWAKALKDAKAIVSSDPVPSQPIAPSPSLPVIITPPPSVAPVDWNLISKLYSIDWKKVVELQNEAIHCLEQSRDEVLAKMQPSAATMEVKKMAETPNVVRAQVTPWYTSKTVWLAAIAAIVPVISLLTKGSINISPETQDMIATVISALAGGGAVFSKITSTNLQPTGAQSALDKGV